MALSPAMGSVTPTLCNVVTPVLVPSKLYVTTEPAITPVFGLAVFANENVEVWLAVTVAADDFVTGLLLGSRPLMVAVLWIAPASTSA